jgi:glycerol-3-phosphate dehydrogenase
VQRDLNALAAARFDVAVIGGGIYGATIAREAALAGLRVALVDRGDFACGTSSNNHKIIHGGLRYLQHLDFRRLRESLHERSVLERIAAHLVHPLPVVVPTRGHGLRGKELLTAGVVLHRLIARAAGDLPTATVDGVPPGPISRARLIELLPGLEQSDVNGGVVFYDSQVYSSERLVIEFLRAACEAGAVIANYAEATGFVREDRRIGGVSVRDVIEDATFTVRARAVVNATGPWIASLLSASGIDWRTAGAVRGMNVVTRQLFPTVAAGLYGRAAHHDVDAVLRRGQRLHFLVPWRDRTIIGTAYAPFARDPSRLGVSRRDVQELLDEVNFAYPPARLTLDDVSLVHYGLLPSAGTSPHSGQAQVAKQYRLVEHSADGWPGLFSVDGVKYTTARDVAVRVVEQVFRSWSQTPPPARSEDRLLPGGSVGRFADYLHEARQRHPTLPADPVERLVRTYGSQYEDVVRMRESADPDDLMRAEARHAVREEMALTLADVVFRRTEIGSGGHPGRDVLESVARTLAAELGWTPDRTAREIADVERRYRVGLDD